MILFFEHLHELNLSINIWFYTWPVGQQNIFCNLKFTFHKIGFSLGFGNANWWTSAECTCLHFKNDRHEYSVKLHVIIKLKLLVFNSHIGRGRTPQISFEKKLHSGRFPVNLSVEKLLAMLQKCCLYSLRKFWIILKHI